MEQSEKKNALIIVGAIAIFSFAAVGIMGWAKQGASSSGAADSDKKYLNCQSEVRKLAKYPSKAQFVIQDPIVSTGGVTQHVTGSVEFMNGFGAMIPQKYSCEVLEFSGTVMGVPTIREEG